MDESRQHIAGQEQLKGDRTGRIEFPHQPGRPAHIHQPSLHPSITICPHLVVFVRSWP
jgi:hypothetical protein